MIRTNLNFLAQNSWVVYVFLVVLITVITSFFETRLYKKLLARLEKTNTFWDDTIVFSLHYPLKLIIWGVGLLLAANVVAIQMENHILTEGLVYAKKLIVITSLVWFFIRFISRAEHRYLETRAKKRRKLDKTTVNALSKIIKTAVLITAALITMQSFNISISPLLAVTGLGGLAISLAAKDILSNFFAGMMLFIDRPFSVGDWVRSPDKEIEGTVEHIGWRLTKIRTFDKRPLYVPNGIFSTVSLENPSRMTNRRIYTKIGLRYRDAPKIKAILGDIEDMLKKHPEIDTKETLMVNLIEFGSSALNFMIYTFTKTTDWVKFQAIQQDVFIKVIDIITQHGAQCAFPTSTVHIPEGIKMQQATKMRVEEQSFS